MKAQLIELSDGIFRLSYDRLELAPGSKTALEKVIYLQQLDRKPEGTVAKEDGLKFTFDGE